MRNTVGVGVIVINDENKILVSRRRHYVRSDTGREAAGAGKLALPGGHLELGETAWKAAKRETREETGLIVNPFAANIGDFILHTKVRAREDGFQVTVFVAADVVDGVLTDTEPEKHEPWEFWTLDQIHDAVKHEEDPWIPIDVLYRHAPELGLS